MERRRRREGVTALVAPGMERRGVLAAFTERRGGVSSGPYRTLNLGFRTGDRPERVVENRRRAARALGVPPFALARQVHGRGVVRIGPRRAGAGFDAPAGILGPADALVTARPGTPVAVLVADCVPVVLADGGTVAVVHAGWRGIAAGILQRAAALLPDGGAAAIGPAIGPCHYEVGEDVAAAVDAATGNRARVERRAGRAFLDLPRTAEAVLRDAGIAEVERADDCTACHPDRFFSYRRDGRSGRQAGVAMLL
ncbi:MAG TPA: polyphenol oxidase family protein [Actinomycetota bacterium]|nr:polyphenol oxidase family protein [Actinomycetota bacterium]